MRNFSVECYRIINKIFLILYLSFILKLYRFFSDVLFVQFKEIQTSRSRRLRQIQSLAHLI